MKRSFYMSTAALLVLAACSQPAPAPDGATAAPAVTADTPAPDTALADAKARRAALPSCADADGGSDCLLTDTDISGAPRMQFEIRYAKMAGNGVDIHEDVHPLSIGVTTPDGTVQQLIAESQETTFMSPALQDLNADGIAELLVPLMTGNVNTVYALYHSRDGTAPYARIGEAHTTGFDVVEGGMFAAPARSSAAEWESALYKIEGGALVSIATAMTEFAPDGTIASCDIRDDGGLAATGLTADQALILMCSQE